MNKKIVSFLLMAFLPLVIFFIVDSFFGPFYGIIFAIIWGVGELIYERIKNKRYDFFILFDIFLLTLMGIISIYLKNGKFFLLKPAVIEFIFVLYLLVLYFSGEDKVKRWIKRYMKMDMDMDLYILRKTILITAVFFFVHAGLILYSAFYLSKKWWLFINGVFLYIAIFVAFIFVVVKKIIDRKKEEILPVVSETGEVIGKVLRSVAHNGSFVLHPVVHLHIIDKEGKILLQKRKETKKIQPGKWDTAVGGHLSFGETIEEALARESEEEMGFLPQKIAFIDKYIMESSVEKELVFTFLGEYNGEEIKFLKREIDEIDFFSKDDILDKRDSGIFTDNFLYEFDKYFVGNNINGN